MSSTSLEPVRDTNLPNRLYTGKVRDTYDMGQGLLLMVATDRISAFDVVLPTTIPQKGMVLSRLSAYWFGKTGHIVPNHLVAMAYDPGKQAGLDDIPPEVAARAMVVKRADRIDIECVVRGYIKPAPGSIGGGNPEMPMIVSVAGCAGSWIPGQSLPRTGYGARNDGRGIRRTHQV